MPDDWDENSVISVNNKQLLLIQLFTKLARSKNPLAYFLFYLILLHISSGFRVIFQDLNFGSFSFLQRFRNKP